MESSHNRFADTEDLPIDGDLKQLMASSEKWSLKNDLELLSHLKQLSNDLINKTENTNHSISSLVFETKIHCVKVDNIINEFQMLANSQFVENRVYDEEMEDITNGLNAVPNEEMAVSVPKDEEILPKIKSALNIGLNFLNERFDCVSKQLPQNDSDDENDEIVEGLISDRSRDQYSQRLLPYIIGSEDFLKDNYVGLSYIEESPAIDLKTKVYNEVKSVEQTVASDSDPFLVRNGIIANANSFIDDLNDSEEESPDLFGAIPRSLTNNERQDSSDESDFEPQLTTEDKNEENLIRQMDHKIESKPTIPSFRDELSAAIGAKNPIIKSISVGEEQQTKTEISKSQFQIPLSLDSESSDSESESIFKVSKSKPKVETKQKQNFSKLFGEESNENSLFGQKQEKQRISNEITKVLPNSKQKEVLAKTSSLFEDDDEEDDDLFIGAITKKMTETRKPNVIKERVKENDLVPDLSVSVKPIVPKIPNESLFDDEEDDDLFGAIASKSNKNITNNSEESAPIVKPTVNPLVNKQKPSDALIGELSSALKKKNLFKSDDNISENESNDKIESNENEKQLFDSMSDRADNTLNANENESKDSLFSEDNNKLNDTTEGTEAQSEDVLASNDLSSDFDISNSAFYSDKPSATLSNDVLKHRAALGSQRQRRPPSKKVLRLKPILDFNQNSEANEEIAANPEERSAPVAAVRSVKTSNKSRADIIDKTQDISKSPTDEQKSKPLSSLVKSPSTEEDDIFPTQTNSSKNPNISKLFSKSDSPSIRLFDDFDDDNEDSLFSSNKTKAKGSEVTPKVVDKTGLFDTSDSEESDKLSEKVVEISDPNLISNLIKPSNSDLFNDVSSTDSSLSNKSDLKIGNSKPTVSLFSDSEEDDDLFSAVVKHKAIDKSVEKELVIETEKESEKSAKSIKNSEKTIEKTSKNLNSLFSDSEDEKSDLFKKSEEIKGTKPKPKPKSNSKPIFDLDEDEEDIFGPKQSKVNTSKPSKTSVSVKTKPKADGSDLFDDPLFASRS